MGAWGHESFSNDSAMDWLADLQESDPTFISEVLTAVANASEDTYLEVDESCAALAAAELVAAALGRGSDRLHEDAVHWLAHHKDVAARVDLEMTRKAVERVFRKSEARDLWDENGAENEWHADVRELLRRLTPDFPEAA